ncbi:MAG TPA: HAMP domain-containing sensor histidine kinase [Geothrix sp.]|nr:HAMP domain-containing sensor histidine kinase [Geothrix sp.]
MNPGQTGGSILEHPRAALAAAAGFACVIGLGARYWLSGNSKTLVLLAGLLLISSLVLAASFNRARRGGPEALGWKILSLSLFINILIQAARVPAFLGHSLSNTLLNGSIVLQVLGSLLLVGPLLSWRLTPATGFERIRHGLDGLLFALATFFILWGLVLGRFFFNPRFPLSERLIWLATFLVYDLLLGLTVFFGVTKTTRLRGPLGWLAGTFLLASLHNFRWLLDVLSGNPVFHFPVGALVFAIPLAYLGAALSPHPVSAAAAQQQAREAHLLPYLPVLGATGLGVWLLVTDPGTGHRLILVWLALGLVVVLLVRQYLALRDFSLLSQQLESRVSERTQALEDAQTTLLRIERMNSMATLGAGLAHDMNNLLGAIQNRAELVIMDLDEGKVPDRTDILRVQEATQRAGALSSRLMTLGRQDSAPPRAMDLAAELKAIHPLLQVLLRKNQTLIVAPAAGPLPFLGTRGMLEQILVNLVGNARDAMPLGGTITLRARAPKGDDEAGPLLEIEDTGTGIPEHLQAQLFQPFFTTKSSSTGTGLGLVSVKSLLESAGGSIDFTTEVGKGTVFLIRLPGLPMASGAAPRVLVPAPSALPAQ